jgi:Sensors of blue-light using FAD
LLLIATSPVILVTHMNSRMTTLGALWCCVYRSTQIKQMTRADVAAMLRHAQMRNVDRNITSSLLRIDNRFLHYLEGPLPALEQLLEKLRADPRHTGFEELFREPIARRRFPNLPIDFSDLSRRSMRLGSVKDLLHSTLEDAPPHDGRGHKDDVFHRVWEGNATLGLN